MWHFLMHYRDRWYAWIGNWDGTSDVMSRYSGDELMILVKRGSLVGSIAAWGCFIRPAPDSWYR